jgi:hypothetical protein
MSIWGALAGGFVGTLVPTALRTASELRLTRMDIPFLLSTAFTANRLLAKALGYLLHFAIGLGLRARLLRDLRRHRSERLVARRAPRPRARARRHHRPRQRPATAPPPTHGLTPDRRKHVALLEPPGFLMLNYGPQTPIVNVLAHIAYGTIVGGFSQLPS